VHMRATIPDIYVVRKRGVHAHSQACVCHYVYVCARARARV